MNETSFTPNPNKKYYMFNKPSGYLTAKSDANRPTIMEFLRDIESPDLHPLGRLDKDTEGMLLLTDDGMFTNYLMTPENHVPKTYEFCVLGALTPERIAELEGGIYFIGSDKITAPCRITVTSTATLTDIIPIIKDTHYRSLLKNHPDHPATFGCITITEGRKHHIKRLMKHVHCCVVALKRVSIGSLHLDSQLAPGHYRLLTSDEIELLTRK